MVPGLLERLPARFVFVVGKGGVGKTTTAGALALGLADAGATTHLLSTDPAHSLGDLFGTFLPAGIPTVSPCSERLTLEELDAPGRAADWFDDVGEAIAELLDRGTYLDRENVEAFLDRALPGMDEVMAALRLAELAESREGGRVVVDTAPTGHTLRLLDCGEVLRRWAAALDAMADKVAAVASGLTGRAAQPAGRAVVEELRTELGRFDEDVLSAADFVLVTRPDPVVAAETGRLRDHLLGRSLRVGATVCVGPGAGDGRGSDPARFTVPLARGADGCSGVRAWGQDAPPTDATGVGAAARSLPGRPAGAGDLLADRKVILFAGKGGVGKSTCAAAFALALAEERPVLLLSLDPAGSLEEVLGTAVGEEEHEVAPGLRARQLHAEAAFDRFRSLYRERIGEVFERLGVGRSAVLDRRVLESLLDMAPPGVDEIFALDAILDHEDEEAVLVIDTAPTGHFLRLLEMPEAARGWVRGLLRILLQYRSVLGLDDFAADVLRLSRRLGELVERLADPERTGIFLVTLPGRLPEAETRRVAQHLAGEGRPLAGLIHNRWEGGEPVARAADDAPTILAPLLATGPTGPADLRAFAHRWSRV